MSPDSLFYNNYLWYFKTVFHSPMILSLVFIADSTIDMCAFIFGPLIDRIYIKNLLKYVTLGQVALSIIATILFYFKNLEQLILVLLLLRMYYLLLDQPLFIQLKKKNLGPAIINKINN